MRLAAETEKNRGLRAKGVTIRAGKKVLVESIDLHLEPGRVQILAGPNGAGKSTLLRALTGEIVPASGSIELDGEPLGRYEPEVFARRRACLPQASSLSFPFRIREVVGIGRIPHRDSNRERERRIDEALQQVGLLERGSENYLHLSGGEKQRVHLARVLAQLGQPKGSVLLLDEPTASLDLTFQQLVFRLAEDWAGRGAVVAMVLHDLNQVMRHGDSVAVLDRGRLVASGAPGEVLDRDLLARVYRVRADWIESGPHRLLAVEGPVESEFYENNEN